MKIKNLLLVLYISISFFGYAQSNRYVYKTSRDKINNLVHTKLDVKFNIPESELEGEAWITATPNFSPTSKIIFDAKEMIIHDVTVNNKKMPYNYFENRELIVDLDRAYKRGEEFTVYVNYTSRPNRVKNEKGFKSIDKKGLYFIDPLDQDPDKPTQIWTEGETENNSVWFPTIDAPNQKTTQEILMTVPNKFVTLSNGTLISQKENTDGTRTDYWKQDQKHAPYLFFMGAGEFKIVKDFWKGIPIEYYVEEKYESLARDIFGKTPEILSFYENLLGVEYPWDKYSQMVARDYISGAMENTTAVVHGENAYQEKGELIDENKWEATIAHEIFHHWFGNIVTAESWSNLALNEAFANYGEYLWFEHAYGKDYADETLLNSKKKYFDKEGLNEEKNLIRFKYETDDDLFDSVSYDKGGMILHMLRKILGDAQFFAGLQRYLLDNKFGTGEAHQLRLAFEAVSGRDLNWFFNQWFFDSGHPKLIATHIVGEFNDIVTVKIRQTEKVYQFPLEIDIYEKDGRKSSHQVWINNRDHSFTFSVSSKPKLVNIDPSGSLLTEIIHNKSIEENMYQYNHAEEYISRKLALEEISTSQDQKDVFGSVTIAMNDPSFHIRILALNKLNLINKHAKEDAIKKVEILAKSDSNTLVRAAANTTLAKLVDPKYINHFIGALESESFSVVESAVIGLYELDKENTLTKVDALPEMIKDNMSPILTGYYIERHDEKDMAYIGKHLTRGLFFVQEKKVANAYMGAFEWIARSDSQEAIGNLVSSLVKIGVKFKKQGGKEAAVNFLRQMQYLQKGSTHSNKRELEGLIRVGMAKLIS